MDNIGPQPKKRQPASRRTAGGTASNKKEKLDNRLVKPTNQGKTATKQTRPRKTTNNRKSNNNSDTVNADNQQQQTSLTNLARLAGISLVPLDTATDMVNNDDCSLNDLYTDPLDIDQLAEQPTTSYTNKTKNRRNNQSLSTISSIQLINQTAPQFAQQCLLSDQSYLMSSIHNNEQMTATITTVGPAGQTTHGPATNYHLESSTIQNLICNSTNNEDSESFSIMKLMSILKNPALTITAITPSSNGAHSNSTQNQPARSQPSTSTSIHDPTDVMRTQIKTEPISNLDDSRMSEQVTRLTMSNKPPIPQSLANLQSSRGGNVIENSFDHITPGNYDSVRYTAVDNIYGDIQDCSRTLDWTPRQDNDKTNAVDPDTLDDIQDPLAFSTSVPTLMHNSPAVCREQDNLSARLLQHIASQNCPDREDNWLHQTSMPVMSTNCDPVSTRRNAIKQLNLGVKIIESDPIVRSSFPFKKRTKSKLNASKNRLYIPRSNIEPTSEPPRIVDPDTHVHSVIVEPGPGRQVYLDDRRSILESFMNSDESGPELDNTVPEPDDIFVERSKRVMSKIDMMLERKRRRRFERISGREAPKTTSLEVQAAESDEEWSDDEPLDTGNIGVLNSQLPLQEGSPDSAKLEHLRSVGLVSRKARNKLLVERCEGRTNLISPFNLKPATEPEVESRLKKFVDAIASGKVDSSQWRLESNIKRNDLPLLESLNRNTGRMKMAYMALLGLDRRSKRTTLYKVNRHGINTSNRPNSSGSSPSKNPTNSSSAAINPKPAKDTSSQPNKQSPEQLQNTCQSKIDCIRPTTTKARAELVADKTVKAPVATMEALKNSKPNQQSKQSNCREAIPASDKGDYMKSLGLTAS